MELEEITEQEFLEYEKTSKYRNFLQTPAIAHLRTNDKWEYVYLAYKRDNLILGAGMFISHVEFLGKREFYSPRGVLTDYNNEELFKDFINELKKYVKNHNGFILRIDPYIEKIERDIDGKEATNGYNNYKIIEMLKQNKFKEKTPEQAKWVFILDVKNKTIDEIYKNMKQNTRNCINKANKYSIKIKEIEAPDIEQFMNVVESTSERKHLHMKTINYYRGIYSEYKALNATKILGAYLQTHEYLEGIEEEIKSTKNKIDSCKDKESNSGKLRELNVTLTSLNKRKEEAIELSKQPEILLSASMFITYGDEVIYFISGNYDKYMHFYAQYKIQYEMIKYAIDNNYETYNFYGISGVFDKSDSRYGVYEFKKGFNGKVVELIGEYYVSCNKLISILYNIKNSASHVVKKIIQK